jgi:uncharacterized repeat protein (TIGR01451 family)
MTINPGESYEIYNSDTAEHALLNTSSSYDNRYFDYVAYNQDGTLYSQGINKYGVNPLVPGKGRIIVTVTPTSNAVLFGGYYKFFTTGIDTLIAPAITGITAADTGGNVGLGNGDTIVITFNVATNQPSVSYKATVDTLIDFGGKSFGADYTGGWSDTRTLVLTVTDAASGNLVVGDPLAVKVGGNLKTADGLSAASTSSGTIGGTFGDAGTDISGSFTDPNFKQAVWEWLGNPVGSTPGAFTQQDLTDRMPGQGYSLSVGDSDISSLAGLEQFEGTGLKYLHCDGNQLTALPTLPGSLTNLYCDGNQLTVLPALPGNLTRLWCGGNQLTSLPVLPGRLIDLDCVGNQLTNLPVLPDGLIDLWCGSNQLTTLPNLPASLEYLYCDRNLLTTLSELPSNLYQFWFGSNYLNVFSGQIKTIIDNCPAETKDITPQYRYTYPGSEITLNGVETYQITTSDLPKQQSSDGTTWISVGSTNLSDFTFTSSDSGVATVDSNGLITARGAGACEIYALYKNIDAEYTKAIIPVSVTSASQLPTAPAITGITAADMGGYGGLNNGDTLTITFDVATNQPPVVDMAAVNNLVDFGTKTFGADYYGIWEDATMLNLTVADATGGTLAVDDTLSIKAGGNLKTADGLSAASTSSGIIGGSFGDLIIPSPGISITITAYPDTVSVNDAVYYTYTVTNTGNVDLLNINITDTLGNTIIGYSTALVAGQSTAGEAVYIVQANDPTGPLENTATVTALYNEAIISDTDNVSVTLN